MTGAQAATDATDENSRETQAEKGKEVTEGRSDTQSYTHTGTYAQMSAHDHAKAASLGFSRVAASVSRSFPRLSPPKKTRLCLYSLAADPDRENRENPRSDVFFLNACKVGRKALMRLPAIAISMEEGVER